MALNPRSNQQSEFRLGSGQAVITMSSGDVITCNVQSMIIRNDTFNYLDTVMDRSMEIVLKCGYAEHTRGCSDPVEGSHKDLRLRELNAILWALLKHLKGSVTYVLKDVLKAFESGQRPNIVAIRDSQKRAMTVAIEGEPSEEYTIQVVKKLKSKKHGIRHLHPRREEDTEKEETCELLD